MFDDAVTLLLFLGLGVSYNAIRFFLGGPCLIQRQEGRVVNILRLIPSPNRIQALHKHRLAGTKRRAELFVITRGFEEYLVLLSHQNGLIDHLQLTQTALDFSGISPKCLL